MTSEVEPGSAGASSSTGCAAARRPRFAALPVADVVTVLARDHKFAAADARAAADAADGSVGGALAASSTDVVEARYLDIVDNDRVVQAVDFESDDTWTVQPVAGGTRVEIVADDVPDGISADDHRDGTDSSLANLAAYVES